MNDSVAPAPLPERIVSGLAKVGLALKFQSWQAAGEQGLSPTQSQILAIVAAAGRAGVRPGAIADQLAVRAPTVTDSVKALSEKGYVERTSDPDDARASLLMLTPRGRAKAKANASWPDFLVTAVATMNEAEQAAFYSGLLKMIATLQRSGQVPLQGMCVNCTHFEPGGSGSATHWCRLLDAPLPPSELRLECPEHEPASPENAELAWRAFVSG